MQFTKHIKLDFPENEIASVSADVGRRLWLQQILGPDEHTIDLGGIGHLLAGWHKNYKCIDDLSGFGPPGQLAGEVIKGDIQALPFKDDEFDVAVMMEVLEHLPDPVRALEEAARVAKTIIITVPNEMAWTNGLSFTLGGHVRFYTSDILAAQFRRAGLQGEIASLSFGTWAFWAAIVCKADDYKKNHHQK